MTHHEGNGNKRAILVCEGTGCVSSRSIFIREELQKELISQGLAESVEVKPTGCHGFCEKGPIVIIEPDGIFYCNVKEKDAAEIVESHLKNGTPVERLFYKDPATKTPISRYEDIAFYKKQQRVVLRNCGHINPENIDDYIDAGGYEGLNKVLSGMSPEQVIDEVTMSKLRGRGGAGFPTGRKWAGALKSERTPKYVVCNADEGDPGAFMDRSTLEADPHAVMEGMVICGYAIGSNQGYIYVRAEYPLAIKRLKIAIEQAKERGFLGENILGSGFTFNLEIAQGAGAFVCGEASALMYSIEGKRGMPRVKPPRSVESGLYTMPTVLNNVKSFATVPVIISRGSDWFAGIGSPESPGTAVFALTGKVVNSGLVEVPMGATLREIIFDIGGGVMGGREFKAVQTGGPSGGCLPSHQLDLPVDFDSLGSAGSIMGSGGMVVMDQRTCMVDVARFFLSFTQEESCGKCNPCRIGTELVLEILERICEGKGKPGDIELLEEWSQTIIKGSLCGLGKSAPNPVLSTIRYFRDEYEAHINEKRCPGGICKELISFSIDEEKCKGCGLCVKNCPTEAVILIEKKQPVKLDQEKCIKCGTCYDACKFDAVIVT
ncbi:MAG: NADH-quinone oxidoreductase subunit NuoF [Chloroflexi bacterium]|nr:NADH-quinone oxidoreductase subunit NuoF [Chloroflexota bacterium]